ncbi:isocitrate lyase/PEP mutase family protein [Salinigranum sp. GCM10025319]|uniref:isocitrate lyase/PEP mutase family protein n=1 Tax=Salinigranum sp. GCM10025319 TaxID=3252687 RepID=UPI003610ACE7
MDTTTQRDRAETFRRRHTDLADGPLVLANAWDCASTILYEDTGFEAVGTSSAAIAATHGVPDGEMLSRDEMLAVVRRIAHSVAIPVSADIEAGYGDSPDAVAETIRETIATGAVGVNLEDGVDGPAGPLVATDDHVAVIRAARAVAEDADVPLVINGRTDVFWRSVGAASDRVERAADRANAYADAGSDCVFVPGVTDLSLIEALVDAIDAPLNVLAGPGSPPVAELAAVGVARVSVGSGPMRATLGLLRDVADELRTEGTYHRMDNAIPYGEVNELLAASVGRTDG